MPESDELAIDIKEIRWHQESMDSSMDLLLKANKEAILGEIEMFFSNARRRAEVFLAVDGQRTVEEIAKVLQMNSPNVSRDLTKCAEEGLIERIAQSGGGGFVWKKKRIDQVLHLSAFFRKKFGL